MPNREPPSVAILAARIMRAYPSLSPYSAASLATELASIERAQRRHAVRCCNGEDGGYTKRLPTGRASGNGGNITSQWNSYAIVHDPDAEQRAGERIERRVLRWRARLWDLACKSPSDVPGTSGLAGIVTLQDDPRGAVLLLHLPGETEASSV